MGIAVGMKDITRDIVSSYDARIAEVGRLKKEANKMLDSFKASHDKMGAQLREDLAQDKTKMRGEVRTMRNNFEASHKKMGAELKKELIQGVTALRSDVKGMLNGFHSSHQQMSAQLRKELADYDRGIKSEVAGMRQETKADLREASAAWQELGSTVQAKRAGIKVPPEVKPPVAEKQIPDRAKSARKTRSTSR